MSKSFLRVAVLFLVPCLVADPVTASAFSVHNSSTKIINSSAFQTQALIEAFELFSHPFKPSNFWIRRLFNSSKPAPAPHLSTDNGQVIKKTRLTLFLAATVTAILEAAGPEQEAEPWSWAHQIFSWVSLMALLVWIVPLIHFNFSMFSWKSQNRMSREEFLYRHIGIDWLHQNLLSLNILHPYRMNPNATGKNSRDPKFKLNTVIESAHELQQPGGRILLLGVISLGSFLAIRPTIVQLVLFGVPGFFIVAGMAINFMVQRYNQIRTERLLSLLKARNTRRKLLSTAA